MTTPRRGTGNDRRLRWGDGWIEPRTAKDGTRSYLARWRVTVDGTRAIRSKTFTTEAAAESHLRDVADDPQRGAFVPPERLTVAELVSDFLGRAAHRFAPSTLGVNRSRARSLILPALGSLPIGELTAPRVQHWIDGLVRRGLGAETIAGGRRLLYGACKDAVMLGILTTNPVTGTRTPAIKPEPSTVWTEEESRAVLAITAADPMFHAAYQVALSTGIRPGELLALRWSDIDLAAGILHVKRTRTLDADLREVDGPTTKGKRTRAIALIPSTVTALKTWQAAQGEIRRKARYWSLGDLVLTTERGDGIRREVWADLHDGVCVVANVPRITPHDCRHTFATTALARGLHPKIVSEMLGHRSVSFTLDRYGAVSVALQRTALEALERSLTESA